LLAQHKTSTKYVRHITTLGCKLYQRCFYSLFLCPVCHPLI